MRILHVTECYAGGVSRAIQSRVKAQPQHEHHLLWLGDEVPDHSEGFVSITKMPGSFVGRVRSVQSKARKLEADIIHAHSSWAGVYARVFRLNKKVIYEPHCFKFDDPSSTRLQRRVYWLAEYLLARNCDVIGVLSKHEEVLARSLNSNKRIVEIPNIASIPTRTRELNQDIPRIVMVGRIAPQKDPELFLEISKALLNLSFQHQAVWAGSGDSISEERLTTEGIRVTGWLDQDKLGKLLSESSCYIHTANYEGFPLSILDAASVNLPILARAIPALSGSGLETFTSSVEAAKKIVKIHSDRKYADTLLENSQKLLKKMNPEKLKCALEDMYSPYGH